MYVDRTEKKKIILRERERWENIQEMLEFRAKRKKYREYILKYEKLLKWQNRI